MLNEIANPRFFHHGLSIAELSGLIKRHISSMASHTLILTVLCFAVVIRLAGASATPEKANLNGLVTNSPFGSAKTGAAGGNTNGEPFEFRSYLEENGSKFFSIYDTATHRSTWVEINDPVNGFAVKSYDAAKENITIDYQGKVMTLGIKRAPPVAQVMQQPIQPMPGPNGMMQPPTNQPGQVGPTGPTAVDQQRIQQIQEEIRRRRALRSQAAMPANTPGQPNYSGGPQLQPSNSMGPVPQPQPIPQKTNP